MNYKLIGENFYKGNIMKQVANNREIESLENLINYKQIELFVISLLIWLFQ